MASMVSVPSSDGLKPTSVVASIPSNDVTGSGKVILTVGGRGFKVRCTVRSCRWRRETVMHADANAAGFLHAGAHQFPGNA